MNRVMAIVYDQLGDPREALAEALDSIDCGGVEEYDRLDLVKQRLEGLLAESDVPAVLIFLSERRLTDSGVDGLIFASDLKEYGERVMPILTLRPDELMQKDHLCQLIGIDKFVVASDVAWDMVPQLLNLIGHLFVDPG